ncbi:hypothetical protein [Streptomyces roseolilacinus]|uniref:hypothetical protein n=1 Tax=Streptomyces roseolilacinus TaxID=66904 RepID=UPI00382F14B1
MIHKVAGPPHPPPAPPVFSDPHGRRRRTLTAVGVVLCLLCLGVLVLGASVLYADPQAPATSPVEGVDTGPLR